MIIFLREKFIAQIMIFAITIIFGIGTLLLFDQVGNPFDSLGRDDEVVLKIGGAKVHRTEFERLVQAQISRNQGRQQVDQEQAQQDAIDGLVERHVFLASADISDAEIKRYIQSDPAQVSAYNAYHRGGLGEEYLQDVRLQMSLGALLNGIQGLELITDAEVENEYRRANDKAKFKFIQFRNHEYNTIATVEDAEAQIYFEENREKYKVDDQVNLKFVKIDPKNFVSDDMVLAHYNAYKEKEYKTPEAVKARHILKKFPDNATDEQKAEVKATAEELLKEVKEAVANGTEFGELAKVHSEDTGSASQGGALRGRHPKLPPGDYFARGLMVPPFEKACFDELEPGQISELVETQYGYHIIKLEEKRPSEVQPFDLVKQEINDRLVEIDGTAEAREVAENLVFDVEVSGYEEAVKSDEYKDLSLVVQDTGLFSQDDNSIPLIGLKTRYRGVVERVFNMNVNEIDIVEAKNASGYAEAYFVMKVLEKKIRTMPPFKEVKNQVTTEFREEKAKQMAFDSAQELLSKREGDESLETLAAKYTPLEGVLTTEQTVKETQLFALSPSNFYVSGMDISRDAMFAAFGMELNEVKGPFRGRSGSYIVQLVERQEPDIEKFESDPTDKNRIRRELLRSKQRDLYNSWIAGLKKQTSKWVHPDYR